MIRMQGAKTSKTMSPCGRRVHIHKSASFKTIFEQIPNIDKSSAKTDSEMIEKHQTNYQNNDAEIHRQVLP